MTANEFHRIFGEHADYWGEDPNHPIIDWASEAGDDNTRLGYWDWVLTERHRAEEEKALT